MSLGLTYLLIIIYICRSHHFLSSRLRWAVILGVFGKRRMGLGLEREDKHARQAAVQ